MHVLIIQTAFIGDVVLATPLIEKLSQCYPEARIDFLVRKGNEGLLDQHPKVHAVLVWNNDNSKYQNLFRVMRRIRREKYTLIVNVQKHWGTGFLTVLSGAAHTVGFSSNPLSFIFSESIPYKMGDGRYEVERNVLLLAAWTGTEFQGPVLYPKQLDRVSADSFKSIPYLTVAPASAWKTKQLPVSKWISFLDQVPFNGPIYLLGAAEDRDHCQGIAQNTTNKNVINLAGNLSLLASASLMGDALMNFTHDSAPLHLASAMNAPVTAVFCSTVPAMGFGPLSDIRHIVEISHKLPCRPCGKHGHKRCPEGHFKCANEIEVSELLKKVPVH